MNPFLQHPQEQGIGYREQSVFALTIACRPGRSALLFALHAAFPWSPIPRRFDLEATTRFLRERNTWIEGKGGEYGTIPLNGDVLAGQQPR
jgi:hypothetical protein